MEEKTIALLEAENTNYDPKEMEEIILNAEVRRKGLAIQANAESILALKEVIRTELPEYKKTIKEIEKDLEERLKDLIVDYKYGRLNKPEFNHQKQELLEKKLEVKERYSKYILGFLNSKPMSQVQGDSKNSIQFIQMVQSTREQILEYIPLDNQKPKEDKTESGKSKTKQEKKANNDFFDKESPKRISSGFDIADYLT